VLWVNALRLAAGWAEEEGNEPLARELTALADLATRSFNDKFWNEERGCLYDVVDQGTDRDCDDKIRPNQVFALSIEHSPLAPERREAVLSCIEHHLVTPMGLRSLAKGEPGYAGVYGGDRRTRDSQYHNGTVWGWLAGPYITALYRVRGANEETHSAARAYMRHLVHHIETDGVGQLAEIFDGDAPFRIRGCSMQAWSIGEAIRVITDHDLAADL
jgi:glycogen debranching enzyme